MAGCSEHDKDDFYLSLEEAIRSVPEDDYLSIAGDKNGHVVSGKRGAERVHGGKAISLINPDGERILDIAIAHDLAVYSTFFAKRWSQKVIPGEDVALQHGPSVADLSIPLASKPKVRAKPRIRWWRLWGSERNELRRAVLEAGLPDPVGPVNETWRRVA
ncbi:unnamed protein product [Heligmosomoides polygyrus]|uniref:FMN_bind domain-containing protein n=1 Tax=Heligmosomoides polygyrus TaxID=6339 RepID=A0A183GC69_HELPZ|nr:unnamed protein product [Heligmosomoides polygyrus]